MSFMILMTSYYSYFKLQHMWTCPSWCRLKMAILWSQSGPVNCARPRNQSAEGLFFFLSLSL